jgi:Xaa-Pro aminopeptidase
MCTYMYINIISLHIITLISFYMIHTDVSTDSMILLDSGGQYLDGTTDVTRTFHTGHTLVAL